MSAVARTVYMVDASIYVFRAWHSMPDHFTDSEGWPTNAVQGFARFLLDLLEQTRPEHIVIAFDQSLDQCYRNEIYPPYKANRSPAPEDLLRQFAYCRALCEALGLPVLGDLRYEADDLIGSVLNHLRPQGFRGVIVSADKDLSQLLAGTDEQWDFARGLRWTHNEVIDKHGVHAHQIADYLALAGDAIDNIPGVPGIGGKIAAALLGHFGSLEELLRRVDEVPHLSNLRGAKSVAAKLREHGELARLYRQLTVIALDAPLGDVSHGFARGQADPERLQTLVESLRLGPVTKRRLSAC
ncbi:5'-3' exonuclease [Aquilutibacter rugosus]|uniref:5'-3' exonuclease n=1 Tax=Aquilutibacter rugosus TaxID=3115820 RepID=UPI002F4091FB